MLKDSNRLQTLCLFDVDGTLTPPRQKITSEVKEYIKDLRQNGIFVGALSGSDLSKITVQLGGNILFDYDFVLPENGVLLYTDGILQSENDISLKIGQENLQTFINYCLTYISTLELPFKTGTFIEFRNAMLNICPPGRNCSQAQREEFGEYDKKNKIRETFVEDLRQKFQHLDLTFSIGGQISFDAFPTGWDKSYCLKYFENKFSPIYFFGDKTDKGGNDHEIFEDSRTVAFSVKSPQDTLSKLKNIFSM